MPKTNIEWPTERIRQAFVDFFRSKDHTFIPGSPVVPMDDPTLLFINAGMNQFKSIFLSMADPSTEFGRLNRVTNSQMCIRAGGKHNDLDDVGNDTYHHTFFEMLGSWSFGNYFKREAIYWAWELLTEVYKVPKDRLYASYFEGDPEYNLEPDEESLMIWREILPEERIIPGSAKDNFWEMGDTGPCGPCTEIHYDYVGDRDAAPYVNKGLPEVLEVWNLVFMEFERREGGHLVPLAKKHVDAGMGLERISAILQGVTSNYDTDLWTPIFNAIQEITAYPFSYSETLDSASSDATVAYRVIADHIRCVTTAIADGAVPDSVGRGFVLRRIIRRAIRYGIQFLCAKPGFFSALVECVGESLGSFFPHLRDERILKRVKVILENEELSFLKTWETGIKHFNRAIEQARSSHTNVISGTDVFILHDRYGFPADLTYLLAMKEDMTVDMEGFNAEMKANQAGSARVVAARRFLEIQELDELKQREVPQTNDDHKYLWKDHSACILSIFDKEHCKFIDALLPENELGDEGVGIIMDETGFYAEAGGQIYDTGRLVAANGAIFEVRKVYNFSGYVVHIGNLAEGSTGPIASGANVRQEVDFARRLSIAANHTTTHLLNWALRSVLTGGDEEQILAVQQKGSLVADDILRFDFSYNSKLSNEQLTTVEVLLNEGIGEKTEVYREKVPLQDALQINGACHIFGEKYPDPVNVVSVGVPVEKIMEHPQDKVWNKYSIEFCGGTHLTNLGDAQVAVILSEDALMKGVRRMVVATREEATKAIEAGEAFTQQYEELLQVSASEASVKALSVLSKNIGDSVIPLLVKNSLREKIDAAVRQSNATLKSQLAEAKERASNDGKVLASDYDALGSPFLVRHVEYGPEREPLQAFAEGFTSNVTNPVGLFLLGSDNKKALAVITMPPEFVDRKLDAVDWAIATIGKGGGKPRAAQSGFPASDVEEVLRKATEKAEEMRSMLLIKTDSTC